MWPFKRRDARRERLVRAKIDVAQSNANNRRHWANADLLSADAEASASVRRTVRSRARYEVVNNSYARGIVLTLANDLVGSGPRLQMQSANTKANELVEKAWATWAREIKLAAKLRTMRQARAQDGEAFALLVSNPALRGLIKLDLQLIEADQVTTPNQANGARNAVDGIVFDAFGNPQAYHILKEHPGANAPNLTSAYKVVPADEVIHWFRQDRPGQSRGLPDILPALPLFAQLRRFTDAVITAAESAAAFAVVMKTSMPECGFAQETTAWTEYALEHGGMVFAPEGWEPTQITPQQPAASYEMFKKEVLNEIARCLNIPYNIAACNSSGYNYASGRLDHQTYYKAIRVEQDHLEMVALDRLLDAWMDEAAFRLGLPAQLEWPHAWMWRGWEHVDPAKEANAQKTRLASRTTTLADEYAREGKDWEQQLRQAAREQQLCEELGLITQQAAEDEPAPDARDDDDDDDDAERNEERDDATAEATR